MEIFNNRIRSLQHQPESTSLTQTPPTNPQSPGMTGDSLMEPFAMTIRPTGITLANVTNQTPGELPC